ncbi:MAG: hypothetical protein KAQ88_00820, partial [Hyphomicrobiaceae bacterium]|nr:hypothetical protein [Hyphomicrobiaceae bacterium]
RRRLSSAHGMGRQLAGGMASRYWRSIGQEPAAAQYADQSQWGKLRTGSDNRQAGRARPQDDR